MAERTSGRPGHPVRNAVALLLAVVLIGGAVVAWRTGWAEDRWREWRADDDTADTDPAAVAAPEGLDLPQVVRPDAVAPAADADARLDRVAIAAALAGLDDKDLGKHVLAAVGPLDGSGAAFQRKEGTAWATPASTTKVVTSVAALFVLGADHTFTTSTVLSGKGRTPTLTLVGGGDPFLTATAAATDPDPTSATVVPEKADLATLARATAAKLAREGTDRVRLAYDDSLFSGPSINPTWEPGYPGDVVAPITALWVDEGRSPSGYGRVLDPSGQAADAFVAALRKAGVTVVGAPTHAVAPPAATDVAAVHSASLADIVQRVLEVSDNEGAEVLLRHVGLAQQGEGSFVAGQRAVASVLQANGIEMRGSVLHDGSGLSRANRMNPLLLLDVLRLAADEDQPDLWPALAGLPVAGFTGSLADRMDLGDPDGLGRVRAKTGTLTGVTSLAGIVVDPQGDLMVFALLADKVRKDKDLLARVAMDNAAAQLGACDCAS